MKWYGYRARWQAEEYPAVVDPRPDGLWLLLQRHTAAAGFESVAPDHYSRAVPAADCEVILFLTTVCEWRGASFQIHDERDEELLVEYVGGDVSEAVRIGLERIERGVYRRWVPRAEIRALHDRKVVLSQ